MPPREWENGWKLGDSWRAVWRAIFASDLGLTPSNEGKQLRLVLPPLSEEQRAKVSAKCKEITEAAPIAGLSTTTTVPVSKDWSGTRLVAPKH